MTARQVEIGCSGWNYRSWQGTVYPRGAAQHTWLRHYAAWFRTVEVNATFYRLATRSTVERWVQETPPDFTFAVKASRYLTHVKRLTDIEAGVGRFLAPLEPLVAHHRLGPILWQLPPTFRRDDDRLAAALQTITAMAPGRHAVEVRHPSWFAPDVGALLRAHDVALVAADDPRRPQPLDVRTAGWRYVRLHHGHRGRRGNYSERELRVWADRIGTWAHTDDVYVYANNDWEAFAPRNARTLGALVSPPVSRYAARRWQPTWQPRPSSPCIPPRPCAPERSARR